MFYCKFLSVFDCVYVFTDLVISKKMVPQKQAEEAIMPSLNQTVARDEGEEEKVESSHFSLKSALWHGGSAYDAWFSCASNQVTSIRFHDMN